MSLSGSTNLKKKSSFLHTTLHSKSKEHRESRKRIEKINWKKQDGKGNISTEKHISAGGLAGAGQEL